MPIPIFVNNPFGADILAIVDISPVALSDIPCV